MTRARSSSALACTALLAGALGCSGDPCDADKCIRLDDLPAPGDAAVHVTNADAACAMQSASAVRSNGQPLDIIFVIDNSGSMTEEIAAVRENINRNFAEVI